MQSAFNDRFQADSSNAGHHQHQPATHDAVETYFSCITTCSLDDGECVTRCVEELREQH
jgi:hypothetical protein